MAHSRSAKKAVRKNERHRVANRSLRSALRTHLKKAEAHLASSEIDEAGAAVANAASQLDRAVTKGLIKKNNAARRKSRLMRKLNAARAAAP